MFWSKCWGFPKVSKTCSTIHCKAIAFTHHVPSPTDTFQFSLPTHRKSVPIYPNICSTLPFLWQWLLKAVIINLVILSLQFGWELCNYIENKNFGNGRVFQFTKKWGNTVCYFDCLLTATMHWQNFMYSNQFNMFEEINCN